MKMDLAIWTAVVFFMGLFLFTDAGQGIIVSSYGHICVDQCEKNGCEYFYCHTTNNKWDYCSPVSGMGAFGHICKDKCAYRGYKYLWCNTVDGKWDYCSEYRSYFDPVIMGSSGGRCTNQCAKHDYRYKYNYCETTRHDWDYCSPIKDKGAYYGASCRSDHPCGKYGKSYTWCYTGRFSWDYCSIIVSEFNDSLTRYGYHCLSACTSYHNYYYCYDWKNWEYCSPESFKTYKNESCRADHTCEKHGNKYFWCYTSTYNDWDYCSPQTNCAYWPAPFTPEKRNKRRKRSIEEICRVYDWSGGRNTVFYTYPDARNRVTNPRGTSEYKRAQAMIAQCEIDSCRGNERAGTLYNDDDLHLRIDLQGMINKNGRRYANIQLQTNGQGSVSLAAVLIRADAVFCERHVRRALVESLERGKVVILERDLASGK